MKNNLTFTAFLICAAIAGFAAGRMTKDCTISAPLTFTAGSNFTMPEPGTIEYNGIQHYLTALDGTRPVIDTTDLEAVKGTDDHYLYQQYKLDGTTFNAYYFRSDWTVYIQTGGHVPDTTVFVKYQGKAVCVSKAVDNLFIKKFLR